MNSRNVVVFTILTVYRPASSRQQWKENKKKISAVPDDAGAARPAVRVGLANKRVSALLWWSTVCWYYNKWGRDKKNSVEMQRRWRWWWQWQRVTVAGINKKLAALPDRASALPLPLPHQGRDVYVLMFYVNLLSIRTELIVI